MTRPRANPIKVFVTKEERAEIDRRAKAANLSLSAYLRSAGLNHPVRSMLDIQTITELSIVHGELGRIIKHSDLGRIVSDSHITELRELQVSIHQIMGKAVR